MTICCIAAEQGLPNEKVKALRVCLCLRLQQAACVLSSCGVQGCMLPSSGCSEQRCACLSSRPSFCYVIQVQDVYQAAAALALRRGEPQADMCACWVGEDARMWQPIRPGHLAPGLVMHRVRPVAAQQMPLVVRVSLVVCMLHSCCCWTGGAPECEAAQQSSPCTL